MKIVTRRTADPADPHASGWRDAPTLAVFLQTVPALTLEERRIIVEAAIRILRGYYVHLPFKRLMHGIDPIHRLQLLSRRLDTLDSDQSFHAEMSAIFAGLRDYHTGYVLPREYAGSTAILPFRIAAFGCAERRQYLVTAVAQGFRAAGFRPGVRLLSWSGVAMPRAVRLQAERSAGANPDAQHARALLAMTVRPMGKTPPPDEAWVELEYCGTDGARHRARAEWRVVTPPPERHAEDQDPDSRHHLAIDHDGDLRRRSLKHVFEPDARILERDAVKTDRSDPTPDRGGTIWTRWPGVFTARVLTHRPPIDGTPRQFGYIRIHTFAIYSDPAGFVAEFARLLGAVPPGGLVLDVRANPGGLVAFAERLLQLLTPRRIEPQRFQFLATDEVLELCGRVTAVEPGQADFSPWQESVQHALSTGETYSVALPMTPPEACNDIGQVYHGPVVLLIDGLSYSATDIFTAGFRDHRIGEIIGTDGNTGAGGANVWDYETIRRRFNDTPEAFCALPHGAGLRVALRRTVRVRDNAGVEIEERGIPPDKEHIHPLTRRDLLEGDVDLLGYAASVLSSKPVPRLDATLETAEGAHELVVSSRLADRLDVFADDRPVDSRDTDPAGDTITRLRLPAREISQIEIQAFARGELIAATRLNKKNE